MKLNKQDREALLWFVASESGFNCMFKFNNTLIDIYRDKTKSQYEIGINSKIYYIFPFSTLLNDFHQINEFLDKVTMI